MRAMKKEGQVKRWSKDKGWVMGDNLGMEDTDHFFQITWGLLLEVIHCEEINTDCSGAQRETEFDV